MKNIAVVGLGNMGLGMARNLLAAGFDVIGFDLRPERAQMLAATGRARRPIRWATWRLPMPSSSW